MEYNCDCCKYTTHKKFNYEKHIESKKHKLLEEALQKQQSNNPKTTIVDEKVATDFTCKYCDQKFSFRQSMNRHIKYTCTKDKEDLKEMLQKLNLKMEQQRKELTSKLEIQEKQINILIHLLDGKDL